ncbi:MAG: alpha-ketoglutarate-dependent dioxygenase AlkB [Gammaproteobacteria bacterium]|nr:alpha-ketoglutarate-dependent dioxygenase AlkB [Pseudomonadales bacterium]MCP5346242.1 alpha-ketoglutarate-dependent dioxygenase AlkB [Pseudomonadales bacterium]
MKTFTEQPDFFAAAGPIIHHLGNAELVEYSSAFSSIESAGYFRFLLEKINWQKAKIRIAGKAIPIPRLQCWVGDPSLTYAYSGIRMQPQGWSEPLQAIRARVQQLTGYQFNAVLLNLYRDGNDSVAWHADDEPELGPNPVVASVSFGACRPFELKPRPVGKKKIQQDPTDGVGQINAMEDSNGSKEAVPGKFRIMLQHGSLLVMGNTIQNNWLHRLPKVKSLPEPRINLTFRRLLS